MPIQVGKFRRKIQTAIRRDAKKHGLRTADLLGKTPCGTILHNFFLQNGSVLHFLYKSVNFFKKTIGFLIGYMIYCLHIKSKCFQQKNICIHTVAFCKEGQR